MKRARASDPRARLLGDVAGRRAMLWIMAIMVFLTVLATALGLGTAGAGRALDRQLAGRLTVQVVEADPAARDAGTAAVLAALRAHAAVAQAREVDREQLAALLRPWLGEAGLDADLPMPAMIDVDLSDAGDTAAVERAVHARVPGARVDRHASWLAPVRDFIGLLGWTALGLVAAMTGATAAVVLLAARAGLDTHRGTIDILHMLGSTDVQIARLFQRRIARDTLAGGLAGTLAGLAAAWFLGSRAGALGSDVLGRIALGPADWLMLAALPFAFTLLAAAAARFSVLQALRRSL